MKKNTVFMLLIFFCLAATCFGAAKDSHVLYLDFGGYRGPYIYPTMNLGYISKSLFDTEELKLNAKIRSYGTWYLVSLKSYDFTLLAEYYMKLGRPDPMAWRAIFGAGANARLRLYKEGTSSVEPVAELGAAFSMENWDFKLPVWTEVYSNGISFAALPEAGYRFDWGAVFYRSEITFLQRFDRPLNDWYWNNFIGVKFYFE